MNEDAFFGGFLVGLFIGLGFFFNFDSKVDYIELQAKYAIELCSENGGINSFRNDINEVTLLCKNGAEFNYSMRLAKREVGK